MANEWLAGGLPASELAAKQVTGATPSRPATAGADAPTRQALHPCAAVLPAGAGQGRRWTEPGGQFEAKHRTRFKRGRENRTNFGRCWHQLRPVQPRAENGCGAAVPGTTAMPIGTVPPPCPSKAPSRAHRPRLAPWTHRKRCEACRPSCKGNRHPQEEAPLEPRQLTRRGGRGRHQKKSYKSPYIFFWQQKRPARKLA